MISRRGFLTWPLTLLGCGVQQNDEPVIVDGIHLEDGMHYVKAQRDPTHASGWRIWVEPKPHLTIEEINSHHRDRAHLIMVDDPGFVGYGRLHDCWWNELIDHREQKKRSG